MSTQKTPAQTIGPWLRANGQNLGALTGQDWAALRAAAECMGLYARCDSHAEANALVAFKSCVLSMQPSTRYLAFHAIAHLLDWGDRAVIWSRCGLAPLERVPACKYGPQPRVEPTLQCVERAMAHVVTRDRAATA